MLAGRVQLRHRMVEVHPDAPDEPGCADELSEGFTEWGIRGRRHTPGNGQRRLGRVGPLASPARAAAAPSSPNSSSVRENSTLRRRLPARRDLRPAGASPACPVLSLAAAIPQLSLLLPAYFQAVLLIVSRARQVRLRRW